MVERKRFNSLALIALILIVSYYGHPAFGQEGLQQIRGPVLGYLFDQKAGIRPVLGQPGAAIVGQSIRLRTPLENVWFAPGADFAVASISGGRGLALLTNLSAGPAVRLLEVPPAPTRVAFSPSGTAVAFFYANPARLVVLAGLPENPLTSWDFQLVAVENGLSALAVSDGGQAALIAARTEPSPVWMVTPSHGQQLLYTGSNPVSLAFFHRSLEAAIAGGRNGEVVLVRKAENNAQSVIFFTDAEMLPRPVAMTVAADNRTLYLANANPPALVILPLDGTPPRTLRCRVLPTRLERMATGPVYRISEAGNGPVWLFDAGPANPSFFYIPDRSAAERAVSERPADGGIR